MAEIRCPMCSKPNPEDAETCSFCGARLKPLVVGTPDEEADADVQHSGGQEQPVPDWLARIRSKAEADRESDESLEAPEPAGGESSSPDWLGRLRQAQPLQEEGPPEGEVPDWLEEAEQASGTPSADRPETGWLDRLRAETPSEAAEEGAARQATPAEPKQSEPDADDALAWLDELEEAGQEEAAAGSAAEGVSPWEDLESPPEPEAAQPPEPQAEVEAPEEWLEDLEGGEQAGLPDWISELTEAGEAPDEIPGSGEPETEAESVPTGPPESDQANVQGEVAAGATDEGTGAGEGFDWDEVEFDWDSEELPSGPEAEPEATPADAGELPHVPALIMGESDEVLPGEMRDFDLSAVELPDWLGEVRGEAGEGEGGRGDLAPATIPNWLEAMRPVETFRPVVDVEPEEEQAVESVGPLAGLRGVLLAEPVVAKPRSATTSGARLEVTERQFAQAELLQRIVEQEEHEVPAPASGRRAWPVARWLVSAVMLLAVLIPAVAGAPVFAVPQRVSRDLGPLVGIVNTLPADRPVLLVFDFEPGYSGELDAVAEPLIENLAARGINIVTLSTRPTGPPLAVDLIDRVGAPYQVENGRNVLHLGYLSGGPSAVQLFSAAPREAILKGFQLPPEMAGESAWASPILANVTKLSDFGMVAVIAAGTDTARTWAEQAHPWMGSAPLVMVLSQGAEPLIRPYFESLTPQVNGILSGLPTALGYEELNGRRGMAFDRWNGFGAGALATEGLLLVGIVYGLVAWFVGRRRA